jgi:peptidylprolyl isomerase
VRRLAVLLLPALVVSGLLTGCASQTTAQKAASKAKDKGLPSVSGTYGNKPVVKVDKKKKPAAKVTSAVLVAGSGPTVAKGDLLVADYLGQVYATSKVFDNSYDRGSPAAFPIGVGQVIKGWDDSLVGVHAGSRVVMVVPPAAGYGPSGNPQAGIKGTDSLIFVVDVIASYGKTTASKSSATPVTGLAKTLPTVTGVMGARPKVSVPKAAVPPTKPAIYMIQKGTGAPVGKAKLAIIHYEAVSFANKALQSTWQTGVPQGFPVGTGQANPFDLLLGVPVGSRVLLMLPPQQSAGSTAKPNPKTDSIVVAIDVLAQHGPAKEAS